MITACFSTLSWEFTPRIQWHLIPSIRNSSSRTTGQRSPSSAVLSSPCRYPQTVTLRYFKPSSARSSALGNCNQTSHCPYTLSMGGLANDSPASAPVSPPTHSLSSSLDGNEHATFSESRQPSHRVAPGRSSRQYPQSALHPARSLCASSRPSGFRLR